MFEPMKCLQFSSPSIFEVLKNMSAIFLLCVGQLEENPPSSNVDIVIDLKKFHDELKKSGGKRKKRQGGGEPEQSPTKKSPTKKSPKKKMRTDDDEEVGDVPSVFKVPLGRPSRARRPVAQASLREPVPGPSSGPSSSRGRRASSSDSSSSKSEDSGRRPARKTNKNPKIGQGSMMAMLTAEDPIAADDSLDVSRILGTSAQELCIIFFFNLCVSSGLFVISVMSDQMLGALFKGGALLKF